MKKDTSLETLKILFDKFYKDTGHYPTTHEISSLGISAKTLQRNYGSLKNLRTLLGLEIIDFTVGKERADKALKSYKISLVEQNRIYNKMLPIFKEYYIHRESPFGDLARQRSDFKVFHQEGSFYVDVYYASDYKTMQGCISAKLKKYNPDMVWGKIILINTNTNTDGIKNDLIENRKTPLPENITLMTENEFFDYCNNLKAIV